VERIGHYIGGKHVPGESGRRGPVFDPATGEQTHEVDFADVGEVDAAVEAARDAFPAWRATSLSKRAEILFRMRELLDERKADVAAVLTAQHGKTLSDAMGEVQRGLENLEFATGIANLLKGGFSEQVSTGVDVYSIRQPLGVAAGITPFNFPAMVPLWMCANAIACGNAFVLKPSEKDPGASLVLAELWKDAGLPDGVFNVIQGDKVVVDRILEHPDIAAVSFVGSTPIARYDRVAGRGSRHGGGRGGVRGLRLGRRAVHGDLGGGSGRRHRRRARREDLAATAERAGRRRARAGERDGSARDARAP
jgi:malonate-semialdehyde dehydrogenase (acetylating)/methylmalonate-semialdehyde dehydrogenase